MAVTKTETGEYVVSSRRVWLPGVYESERAAKYATRFDELTLHGLQKAANERGGGTGGVITFADLQAAMVK